MCSYSYECLVQMEEIEILPAGIVLINRLYST